jgi:peptide chain release factor 2
VEQVKKRLAKLLEQIRAAWTRLRLDDKIAKLKQLETELARPEIWNDPTGAAAKAKTQSRLSGEITPWRNLKIQTNDLLELAKISEDDLLGEFEAQTDALGKDFARMRRELWFGGEYDAGGAILRLSAGAGGDDAQDWTAMLERMYLRWSERNNYAAKIITRSPGEVAGVKTSVIEIDGAYAYGKLKSENGVHRLVRLSPFNTESRETSFALVEVLPKIDAPDAVRIDPKDLRVDIYHASGHGGQGVNTTDSAVRLTHLPTGIVVAIQNERSQLQNKEKALEILRGKLAQLAAEQHQKDLSKLRAGESASWGSQIRNYVLHPYKLVKDTRTGYESKNPDDVLDGAIDGFIDAYLQWAAGENPAK